MTTHILMRWRHYEEASMKPVCQLFFRDVEETEMNSRVSSNADLKDPLEETVKVLVMLK